MTANSPDQLAHLRETEPTSPAREVLQAQLAGAEERRAEASLRVADAEEAYRDANEDVILFELALADLGRRDELLTQAASTGDVIQALHDQEARR